MLFQCTVINTCCSGMHVIYCNLLKCHVVVTHCNLPHIMLVNKVTFIKKKKKKKSGK